MDASTFLNAESMGGLLTLALLEIVLGIDNLVFIAILTSRLPEPQQPLARRVGLMAALVTRVLLLLSITWVTGLTRPLFTIPGLVLHGEPVAFTGRALILFAGGLFLIWKAVSEIYHKVELHDEGVRASSAKASFGLVIVNIAVMDVIFSLDSVITAVGIARHLWVMIGGIVIAMAVMVLFSDAVSAFIGRYASLKILALAFLLMIGTLLTAEALEFEIPKGFVYFAMFFSLAVELIQIRYEANLARKRAALEGGA